MAGAGECSFTAESTLSLREKKRQRERQREREVRRRNSWHLPLSGAHKRVVEGHNLTTLHHSPKAKERERESLRKKEDTFTPL